jgi:hypothetical protein
MKNDECNERDSPCELIHKQHTNLTSEGNARKAGSSRVPVNGRTGERNLIAAAAYAPVILIEPGANVATG